MSAAAVGCSGGDDSAAGASNGADGGLVQPNDGSLSSDSSTVSDAPTFDVYIPPTDSGTTTFAYKPGWAGAKEVDVIGGFGTSDDWDVKKPYLTLVDDGTKNYTGSAVLPAGTYAYVFHVVGDSAAGDPKFDRYAIDPLNPSIAGCPTDSPTANKGSPQSPCSQLTVGTPDVAPVHITGNLTVDGAAAVGWLVTLTRSEKATHPFFVNRITTGNDGAFDLVASAGTYKVQVDLPTALNTNDIDRDPLALNVVKSAKSGTFMVGTSNMMIGAPDLAFHDYGSFAPTGNGGTLPTKLTFEKRAAVLDVYGGSKGSSDDAGVIETGDPWFSAPSTDNGKYTFDGNFSDGPVDAAVPGVRYMWGTEEHVDAGAPWMIQSLVFPITWQ
jgi:hypothetical protein